MRPYYASLSSPLTYDIIEIILNELGEKGFYHLVQQTYLPYENINYAQLFIESNMEIDETLYQSLITNNQATQSLEDQFEGPSEMINYEKLSCMINSYKGNDAEDAYQKIFRKSAAFFRFMIPAFNTDRDQCLVVFSANCGLNCGYEFAVFLEKLDESWTISYDRQLREIV